MAPAFSVSWMRRRHSRPRQHSSCELGSRSRTLSQLSHAYQPALRDRRAPLRSCLRRGLFWAAPLTSQLAVLTLLKFCLCFFLLLGLIFMDFERHLLPDILTLSGFVAGLIFSIFNSLGEFLGRHPHPLTRRLLALKWPLGAISLLGSSHRSRARSSFYIWSRRDLLLSAPHRRHRIRRCKAHGHGRGIFPSQAVLIYNFTGALLGSIFSSSD